MSWTVIGGPIDHADPGVDGRGWIWELERDGEVRRVFVQVSGTALAVRGALPPDTEAAIATRGGSEIDRLADSEELPAVVSCTTEGCSPRS